MTPLEFLACASADIADRLAQDFGGPQRPDVNVALEDADDA
jgi:hypothetical protein